MLTYNKMSSNKQTNLHTHNITQHKIYTHIQFIINLTQHNYREKDELLNHITISKYYAYNTKCLRKIKHPIMLL